MTFVTRITACIALAFTTMMITPSHRALAQNVTQNAAQDTSQDQVNYTCVPAIRIVADLGYCFGFTVSYFEALEKQDILTAIATGGVEANIAAAHGQCYPTDFASQKHLGKLAFSSYINLADDTLLRQTGNNCRVLLDHYAKQYIQHDNE